jgi:PQQ-dependent dehydrogenase (methanol/ethanol family)
MQRILVLVLLSFVSLASLASVDSARIINADQEPGNWLTHGRDYAENRQSPLTQIRPENVGNLGLAWFFDTGTTRGLEASPLVFDGRIFTTGSWSKVFALDARNGELIWSFDPLVPRAWGVNACCDVVNRGVGAWGDKLFVGTIDGRLIALDQETGDVKWDVLTIDRTLPYTITGAPRVVDGVVIIGNGGAEFGVRGYVSGYDAETGDLIWRFYTVPGDPSKPHESPAMKMAAETWTGDVYWQVGGGGTVWDSMAYDPKLDLLYFGVGNGAPWNRNIRSPEGGDNLFLSSIVAIRPATGEYVWHYQTTPADTWDYTATQHIILADLEIDGNVREVLMQAPKNGFFYVIDRASGELISAEKYTVVNWASHVDMATGRPVETDVADHSTEQKITHPSPLGGHNWHPMAFNQDAGLVYIPAMESQMPYSTTEEYKHQRLKYYNTGQNENADNPMTAVPPGLLSAIVKRTMKGKLIAWDPVKQEETWRVDHETMWNGGVLTTASGLVFQGTGSGKLVAYDAFDGTKLWETDTRTGIIAPPVTYEIDGEQYVAIMAGWGGAGPLILNMPGSAAAGNGRMLVYKLDGQEVLPTAPERVMPEPPPRQGTDDSIEHGSKLFNLYCGRCHGMSADGGRVLPDLRYMSEGSHEAFKQIVLGGLLKDLGMVSHSEVLSESDAEAVHDFIIAAANDKWDEDHSAESWKTIRSWFYDQVSVLIDLMM